MILAGTENDEEIWVRDCYEHPVEDNMKCEQHLERGILVDVCFCSDDLCNSMMGTIPTETSTPASTTSDSIGKFSHHQNITIIYYIQNLLSSTKFTGIFKPIPYRWLEMLLLRQYPFKSYGLGLHGRFARLSSTMSNGFERRVLLW